MSILSSLAAEFVSYYKAILSRSMFSMHALVAVWRTTVIMGALYWSLVIGIVLLVVEYFVTMWVRMGEEWPWISPSTLCYLTTAAAALWVQKLESLGHIEGTNGTYVATLPSTGMQMDFSAADWLLLTEQSMMVTIILSRWLLPKGAMSHKDLSSLLLLYLALSADILDFSTIFNEPSVVKDKTFCYVILVVWTLSLAQFVLVLTNTASVDKEDVRITLKSIVCSSEIWQILVQIGMQDLPFLFVRLIALLQYQVFNFTIIFFVCKNSLVICLEMYHLVATCVEQQRKLKKRKARMKHLKSKMASVKKVVGLSKLSGITAALKGGGGGGDSKKQNGGENGNVKGTTVKPSALSIFAAKLSKPKPEENGNGKEKKEGKESVEIATSGDNLVGNGSSTQTKSVLFAAAMGNYNNVKGKNENGTAAVLNKPLTQSSLLKALNKQPALKDVNTDGKDDGYTVKEPLADDLARTGSELAGENNNWFDNNNSTLWPMNTPKSQKTARPGSDSGNQTSDKIKTPNGNGNGIIEDTAHAQTKPRDTSTPIEFSEIPDDPSFNALDQQNESLPAVGYLERQSTTMSIPPVSHLRSFQDRRESTGSSLDLTPGRSEPRDLVTPSSIFHDDDSVF